MMYTDSDSHPPLRDYGEHANEVPHDRGRFYLRAERYFGAATPLYAVIAWFANRKDAELELVEATVNFPSGVTFDVQRLGCTVFHQTLESTSMKRIPQANNRAVLNVAEHLKGVQYAHASPTPKIAKARDFDLFEKATKFFEHYDTVVGNAKASKNLSAVGIRAETKPHRDNLDGAIFQLHHNAKGAADKAKARRAQLFAPPALDPADAVSAIVDIDVWKRYETLSETQKQEALQSPRVVEALAREPFLTMQRQIAQGILRKRAEETHAEELATLDDAIASSEWLLTAASSMRTAFDATKDELGEPTTAADIAAALRAAREGVPVPSQPGISPTKDDLIAASIAAHEQRQQGAAHG